MTMYVELSINFGNKLAFLMIFLHCKDMEFIICATINLEIIPYFDFILTEQKYQSRYSNSLVINVTSNRLLKVIFIQEITADIDDETWIYCIVQQHVTEITIIRTIKTFTFQCHNTSSFQILQNFDKKSNYRITGFFLILKTT